MSVEIRLAADLVPLVLSGRKTSTIRSGVRRYRPGAARIVSGSVDIPIEITDVQFTQLRQLDSRIANSEGYGSIDELLMAVRRFYPELKLHDEVTVVRFRKL
ncbi:ASCH domain-containing protein [Bradyrhizobium sp. SZCCHNS3053]|uniref:ASCH domain-containing protein n=1 Tax=Bradyrhizobium sp. SZCCHNS3053 TaxID=3057322 RepID=UPI00396790A8